MLEKPVEETVENASKLLDVAELEATSLEAAKLISAATDSTSFFWCALWLVALEYNSKLK